MLVSRTSSLLCGKFKGADKLNVRNWFSHEALNLRIVDVSCDGVYIARLHVRKENVIESYIFADTC